MATIVPVKVQEILKIANTGITNTLSIVRDGTGNTSPLKLSATQIALNDQIWPTVGGTTGQALVIGSSNNLVWQDVSLPIASSSVLGGVKIGSGLTIDGAGVLNATASALAIASATVLGGIKVGTGLAIDGSGILSSTGALPTGMNYTSNSLTLGDPSGTANIVTSGSSNLTIATPDFSGGTGSLLLQAGTNTSSTPSQTGSGVTIKGGGLAGTVDNGVGGAVTLQGGTPLSSTSGIGGGVNLLAANGPSSGGKVSIQAGNGTVGNGDGGIVEITAGTKSGTGSAGSVLFTTGGTERFKLDGSGAWLLASDPGSSGQVLTSNGAANPPTWQSVGTGGVTFNGGTITNPLIINSASYPQLTLGTIAERGHITSNPKQALVLTSGAGTGGANAGNVSIMSGATTDAGNGGNISLQAGDSATGNGGNLLFYSGQNTTPTVSKNGAVYFYMGGFERFSIKGDGSWTFDGSSVPGTTGQVLTSNGTGASPTWQSSSASNAANLTGGAATQIPYQTSGTTTAFSDNLTWNATSKVFSVGDSSGSATVITIGGSSVASRSLLTIRGRDDSEYGSNVVLRAGNNKNTSVGTDGGALSLLGGSSSGDYVGGGVTITAGANGSSTGSGGNVTIKGGAGGDNAISKGGTVSLIGGVATAAGTSGAINFTTNNILRLTIRPDGAWSPGNTTTAVGTVGQVLTSQGAASPIWADAVGGGGTPGGASGQFQYNNGGVFAGGPLTFDGTNTITHGVAGQSAILTTVVGSGIAAPLYLRTGTATASPGANMYLQPGTGTTDGGWLYLQGAAATSTGTGGSISITAGAGSTSATTGVGGAVTITGGASAVASGVAGDVSLVSGQAASGTSGNIKLTASTGTTSGSIYLTTGGTERLRVLPTGAWSVGSTGTAYGASGQVLTSTGASSPPTWQTVNAASATVATNIANGLANQIPFQTAANTTAFNAGFTFNQSVYTLALGQFGSAVAIVGNSGLTNAPGSPITLAGGDGGTTGSQNGGSVTIKGGAAGTAGGGSAGSITIQSGGPGNGVASGSVLLAGGDGTQNASGSVIVRGGNNTSTGVGGNLTLAGGTSTGAAAGYIALNTTGVERLRILNTGAFSFGSSGTAYGTTGQVLTSNGNGQPTWADSTVGTWNGGTVSGVVTFNSAVTFVSVAPQITLGTAANAAQLIGANASLTIRNTTGTGSIINIQGADSTTTSPGGRVNIQGGASSGASSAGAVTIAGGAKSIATATAGAVTIDGGTTTVGGAGADVTISAGNNTAAGTVGTGGNVRINGGFTANGTNGSSNGSIYFSTTTGSGVVERFRISQEGTWLLAGASGSTGQVLTSGGAGGLPTWSSFSSFGNYFIYDETAIPTLSIGNSANGGVIQGPTAISGTSLTLIGGKATAGPGGAINIQGADGTSAGGTVTIVGGKATNPGLTSGGVIIAGGASNSTTGNGGGIDIRAGVGGTGGVGGDISFKTAAVNTLAQRLKITKTGAWSLGSTDTNIGTTGQVLTSTGDGTPIWSTVSGGGGGGGLSAEPDSSVYTYDTDGNVSTVTDLFGGSAKVSTYTYVSGVLTTVVVTFNGATRTETYTYNPNGTVASMTSVTT